MPRLVPLALPCIVLGLLAGCATTPGKPSATTPAPLVTVQAPELDGHQRLSDAVTPTAYTLDMTVDPSKATFSGTVTIDMQVQRATDELRMHANGPTITSAVLVASDNQARAVQIAVGKNGGIAARTPTPIPVGKARLTLSYTAPIPQSLSGIYRVKADDEWYAFTQFQPLEARRAFPCFDQPEFKTPFTTTLRVKKGDLALSNGPEVGRRDEGDHTVYTFAPTKPLPTYLVALAVGPFDVVTAAPQEGLPPIRTITTKGKGKLAQWANVMTGKTLLALQDYFGAPYPYAKLDQVAVPNFGAGAMENVGLVTYRERLLLLGDGKDAPPSAKMWATVIIAHELGHMWFGNKVTLAWWNDIWLNEAFATWISFKIADQVAPEFEAPLALSDSILRTMSWDAQAASRAIRQPIAHGGDVYNAFDPITYRKGASVLTMFEAWLGEETFRKAVRTYIDAHAHGIATTPDLLKALSKASGKNVEAVAARFLEQPGTPLVDVKLQCGKGKSGGAELLLSQTRYLPTGSDTPAGKPWTIPMCFRFGGPGLPEAGIRHCSELSASKGTVTLPTKRCPAWVHPNDHERGYYRWTVEPRVLKAMMGQHRGALANIEKAAMANHLSALLEAGKVDVGTVLDALKNLSKDTHHQVVRGLVAPLRMLARHVPSKLRSRFASRVAQPILGPHIQRLGFIDAPSAKAKSFADRRLRPWVSSAFLDLVEDPKAAMVVARVAQKGLADFDAVPTALFTGALPMAGRSADVAFVNTLAKSLKRAPTPAHRVAMVRAMGTPNTPEAVVAGLERLLDGTLRAQDLREIRRYSSDHPEAITAAWQWMKANYGALVKLMGDKASRHLVWFGQGLCSAEEREDFRTFFADPKRAGVGVKRVAGIVDEVISRCTRMRATLAPALQTVLAR